MGKFDGINVGWFVFFVGKNFLVVWFNGFGVNCVDDVLVVKL